MSASNILWESRAANTVRAYRQRLKLLRERVRRVSDRTLSDYLWTLHQEGLAPSTCRQVVAAVRFDAKCSGRKSPVGPISCARLMTIGRAGRGRGRGQVVGIDWRASERMCQQAELDGSLLAVRDAALISTASDAMLRTSEVVSLTWDDVVFCKDGTGRLRIGVSKTDQLGRGHVSHLTRYTCARLLRWRSLLAGADGSADALFCHVERERFFAGRSMSAAAVRNAYKRWAKPAGVQGWVSGHSLRIGSAQSMALEGFSTAEIQAEGRWSTPAMVAHYIKGQSAGNGPTARAKERNLAG